MTYIHATVRSTTLGKTKSLYVYQNKCLKKTIFTRQQMMDVTRENIKHKQFVDISLIYK